MNGRSQPFSMPHAVAAGIVWAVSALLVACLPVLEAVSHDVAADPDGQPGVVVNARCRLELDYSSTSVALRIALPPADVAAERAAADTSGSGGLQIGFNRVMPGECRGDLSPLINWVPLVGGSLVGTVSVTSPEALAMRAGIFADLSAGGEIRFLGGYAVEGSVNEIHGEPYSWTTTWKDFYFEGNEPELLWSPTVEGDTIGLEITLPSRAALSTFFLTIEEVAHIYVPHV